MNGPFSDAALVLVGHGSTLNSDSAAPVFQHAAELRRRMVFKEVREAFWKQEPRLGRVLAQTEARRVFVVPLLISAGYFANEVIPGELGLAVPGREQHSSRLVHYCAPVGTHRSMTDVILNRAREVVELHPFPRAPRPQETALFIAGHGTLQNRNSRRASEDQANSLRAEGRYAQVEAVYLEEEPKVSDCCHLARVRHVVVVPFFISDGLHAAEDIPILLGEPEQVVHQRLERGQSAWQNPTEKSGKLVWYGRSVGTEPHLTDVILERVREAATQGS